MNDEPINHERYDLVILGAGSGGVRAARMAAAAGARVAIIEQGPVGGTCVNAGCIPKKLLVYAAEFSTTFEHSRGYGWSLDSPAFSWPALIQAKNREISRLNGLYERMLADAGAELIRGRGRFTSSDTLVVGDRHLRTRHTLIATGGGTWLPDIPGIELAIGSDQALNLPRLPERIVVVGGGYIAIEFACLFRGLGVETTLVYRGPLILRGFDEEMRRALQTELDRQGIRLCLDTSVTGLARDTAGLQVMLDDDSSISCDEALFATGRRAATQDLGLEHTRVRPDDEGAVITDGDYRTTDPHIYAIGDVAGRHQLTPVAIAEAMALVSTLYGDGNRKVDYSNIPTCVFSQPNLAMTGLTESQAREAGYEVRVYRAGFRSLKLVLTDSRERTTVKLVVDAKSDRVLGAHMLGPDAGEIIQGFAVAITAGARKSDLDRTIGIHPTIAEEFLTLRTPVTTSADIA